MRLRFRGNAGFLLLALVSARGLLAQSQLPNGALMFGMASVKPSVSTVNGVRGGCRGIDSTINPSDPEHPVGHCVITDGRLSHLLAIAFGVRVQWIKNTPDWVMTGTERFDVEAKSAEPTKATEAQLLQMLQNFLLDQFKVKLHWEDAKTPALALVAAKDGIRLQESKSREVILPFTASQRPRPGEQVSLSARKYSMLMLENLLTSLSQRIVVDTTGIRGEYDINLTWDGKDVASLSTALDEQLGLRLEPKNVPVKFLILDAARRPNDTSPVQSAEPTTQIPQPTNLDFHTGEEGQTPPNWFVPPALKAKGYSAELRYSGCGVRPACAVVMTVPEPPPETFGNLMRSVSAGPYRGKTVRLTARLKLDSQDPSNDSAQMWLRVDRPNRETGFFDNMNARPVRTAVWREVSIVGPVAKDAEYLALGVISIGRGNAWVEGMTLEVVPNDTVTTAPVQRAAFGFATGTFPVKMAAGKRVRFTGYIKTEEVTRGYAGLWWRVDGGSAVLAFDNMHDRGVKNTSNWQFCEIILDVPANATNINFGALFPGNGTAWFDGLMIELNGIPYFDLSSFDLDFEGPKVNGFHTGGDGYRVELDAQTVFHGLKSLRMRYIGSSESEP